MQSYPSQQVALDDWTSRYPAPGIYMLTTQLEHNLAAHANVAVRVGARRMVVFLPGAQGAGSVRRVPFFHRWTWHEDLSETHVVALGDPSIALDERLRGGWFMHPEIDLISELASIVQKIATTLDIKLDSVTIHGSSLGGFGAIGIAAHLPGSYAIAEIPQIDVERWPVPSAIHMLEEVVRQPLSEFRKVFPERVDLISRLLYAKVVPPLLLITNENDTSYDQQKAFLDSLPKLSEECDFLGEQSVLVTDSVSGHTPLPKEQIIEIIRGARFS